MSGNYPRTYTLRLTIDNIPNLPAVSPTDKVQVIIRDQSGRMKTSLVSNLRNIEAVLEADKHPDLWRLP